MALFLWFFCFLFLGLCGFVFELFFSGSCLCYVWWDKKQMSGCGDVVLWRVLEVDGLKIVGALVGAD
jgi:hypothetical protein